MANAVLDLMRDGSNAILASRTEPIAGGDITASGSITESRDTAAGSASVDWPAITATGAISESRDAASGMVAVGDVRIVSGAVVERRDAASGAASLSWPEIAASAAITERRDAAAGAAALTPAGLVFSPARRLPIAAENRRLVIAA